MVLSKGFGCVDWEFECKVDWVFIDWVDVDEWFKEIVYCLYELE